MIFSVFFFAFFTALFVIIIDPYDYYPWGKKAKFTHNVYNPREMHLIINGVLKSDFDTFYLGASTSAAFNVTDIINLFPETKKAINASMVGGGYGELQYAMEKVSKAPNVRRVFVQLERFFWDFKRSNRIKGRYITDGLNTIDIRSVRLAFKMLINNKDAFDEFAVGDSLSYIDWNGRRQSTSYVKQLSIDVKENRKHLTSSFTRTCDDFPNILPLKDLANKLEERKAELIIVVPAYSRVLWFEMVNPHSMFYALGDRSISIQDAKYRPFDDMLKMRYCVTKILDKHPNTKIFTFDRDDIYVGNYANFYDPAHFYNLSGFRSMLQDISSDKNRITLETFPEYEKEMRERTLNYQFLYEPKNE